MYKSLNREVPKCYMSLCYLSLQGRGGIGGESPALSLRDKTSQAQSPICDNGDVTRSSFRAASRHRSHYIRKGFTRNFIKYQKLCSSQALELVVVADKYYINGCP